MRWDKNFLTLIHLTLARRDKLKIYGGVRFGGALPIDEAWSMGIDHIAIAAGAGRPTIIDIKNNLIRGIRKASDFLMALQLTGAFKKDVFSNLQARLPAVVIGGGLTGVDTATELMAYYPLQAEKMVDRYDALVRDLGEARVRGMMDPEEIGILDEFRAHGAAVKAERARAQAAGEAPNFIDMIRELGRRDAGLSQAPAGRAGLPAESRRGRARAAGRHLRHREHESGRSGAGRVRSRQGDGVHARRRVAHRAAGEDRAGRGRHRAQRHLREGASGLVHARQQAEILQGLQGGRGFEATAQFALEPDADGFFTSHNTDGKLVSYYGDNHPRYNGNVVKAMASAKHGYPARRGAVRGCDRGARSGAAAGARSGVAARWSARSTTSCWPASSA